MTSTLIAYADGDVYLDDLDLDRPDVILENTSGSAVGVLDLAPLRLRLYYDTGTWDRLVNLAASLLLYASGRRPVHPVRGDVLIAGLGADDEPTDVPDDLADLFRRLALDAAGPDPTPDEVADHGRPLIPGPSLWQVADHSDEPPST